MSQPSSIGFSPQVSEPIGARRALLIANARYEDPAMSRLRAPAQESDELARVLRDPRIGGFEVDVCQDATEPTLRRQIARFFAGGEQNDVLVLHYSGHGIVDLRGRLYLAARDTELRMASATAVAASFVAEQMGDCAAGRIVLILDCCYSGMYPPDSLANPDRRVRVVEEVGGDGRVVLTASSAAEYAFDGERLVEYQGLPSVFTAALARGLATGAADLDGDGEISLDELYDYAAGETSRERPGRMPAKSSQGFPGTLVMARAGYAPAPEVEAAWVQEGPWAEPAPEEGPEPTPAPAPKPQSAPEARPARLPPPVPVPKARPQTQPQTSPKPRLKTPQKTQPKARPKAQPKAPSKTGAKAQPKTQPKARPKSGSKAGPKAGSKAGPKAGPTSRPKTRPKSRPNSRSRAKARSVAPKQRAKRTPHTSRLHVLSATAMAAVLVLIGATAIVQGRAQDAAATAALGWKDTVFPGDAQGDGVQQVAFSPDDKFLAAGYADNDGGFAQLWATPARQLFGQPLDSPLSGPGFSTAAFSPDATMLAAGYGGTGTGMVRLWNPADGKPIGQPLVNASDQSPVQSVTFSPDGKLLAVGYVDAQIQLWDPATGKEIGAPLDDSADEGSVVAMSFSPDGETLAAGYDGITGGTVQLWSLTGTGTATVIGVAGKTLSVASGAVGVSCVTFSPDGKTLAAVSDAGTAVLWDPATGQAVDPALTAAVNQSAADSVAFSPDGATIAVGYSGGTVQLWNQTTARPVGQPLALADEQRNDLVTSMDFTPDGKTLAAGTSMGAVQIWVLADQAGISPQGPRRGRSG